MSAEQALQALEQQLAGLAAALLATDAQRAAQHGSALRAAAAHLAQLLQAEPGPQAARAPLPAHWQRRSQAIATSLRAQRAGLARLCTLTGQQLENLLPARAHALSTYGADGLVSRFANTCM